MSEFGSSGDFRSKNKIPEHLLAGLKRYVKTGTRTGDCLKSLLANDFLEAMGRADRETVMALPALAVYIYMEMPGTCHGSYDVYKAWTEHGSYKFEIGDEPTDAENKQLVELAKTVLVAKNEANKRKIDGLRL